jgi:hypothetical protein
VRNNLEAAMTDNTHMRMSSHLVFGLCAVGFGILLTLDNLHMVHLGDVWRYWPAILAERKRLGLYLAAWLPVAFLLAVLVALAGRAPWPEALALALPLSAVYAFQCLPSWYLCRSFPLQPNGLLNAAAVLGLAAATSAGPAIKGPCQGSGAARLESAA